MIARIPTIINERKITANLALISLSVKESPPLLGMKIEPKTNEIIKETAILDTGKRQIRKRVRGWKYNRIHFALSV